MPASIIVPKLGLRKLSFADLDVYASDRIIDVPVVFPTTTPTIATVTGLQTAYHTAVANWRRGNKASTELKHATRRDLQIALTDLAYDCANQANGNIAMYLLTGFDIRVHGSISGLLPAPADFKLMPGDDGQLIASFTKVLNNHGYEISLSLTPFISPTDPRTSYVASKTKVVINQLTPGQRYYGRVRAIGARNQPGIWSDISGKICP